jgi:hypothetical protein
LRSRELPKLYYPTPDELQGATPLNENLWMREYQGLMLALANTKEGKDLLCIEDEGLPIIGMRKNAVLYDKGTEWMADFRVGAKWGNVVRYRWQEVRRALERMNELFLLKAMQSGVPAGAATITEYSEPNVESTTVDGYCYHNANLAWSTIRAAAGNSANDSAATLATQISATSTSNQWERIMRAAALFDTSALGAGSTVTAGTLMVAVKTRGDTVYNQSQAVVLSDPASNTAVVGTDYARFTSDVVQSNVIDLGTLVVDETYDDANLFTLTSTGRGNISLTGVTKFGFRLSGDYSNTEPSWASNQADYIEMVSADASGTSTDPRLIVTYTPPPFTPRAIMF